eukprot:4984085-Amphidinium_carterae.1
MVELYGHVLWVLKHAHQQAMSLYRDLYPHVAACSRGKDHKIARFLACMYGFHHELLWQFELSYDIAAATEEHKTALGQGPTPRMAQGLPLIEPDLS